MSDAERILREALDARARQAVPDHAAPPAPRFGTATRHSRRWLAPLAAAAAVIAVVGTVLGLQSGTTRRPEHVLGARTSSVAPSASQSRVVPAAHAVHIKLLNADGARYGVGMPVVAFFSKKITSGTALQGATHATANGKPLAGAWYFEYSSYYKGYPIEAHWRPQDYWPAHARVHLDIAARGLPAGHGMAFDDNLTLDFTTGAANLAVVNDATHTMTVTSDGRQMWTFPVSLGSAQTPTRHGVKVIMEKLPTVCMHDVAGTYYECGVKLDQRLTYDGEYLHSAPWNVYNIEHGIDSSNGCTNLLPADAALLYKFLKVGDVVKYPNASGKAMAFGDGYGDWNIPWRVWVRGGIIPS